MEIKYLNVLVIFTVNIIQISRWHHKRKGKKILTAKSDYLSNDTNIFSFLLTHNLSLSLLYTHKHTRTHTFSFFSFFSLSVDVTNQFVIRSQQPSNVSQPICEPFISWSWPNPDKKYCGQQQQQTSKKVILK